MLARLARFLRAAGFDTTLADSTASDAQILREAIGEERWLLTADRKIMDHKAAIGHVIQMPFGSLDAQTRENLQEEFLRIWERTSTTVVFVTHSIDEAVFLSNRVVVLSSSPGRVREIIPVDLPHHRLDKGTRTADAFIRACAHVRELLREAYAQAEG